jgi:small GTP-binding protein
MFIHLFTTVYIWVKGQFWPGNESKVQLRQSSSLLIPEISLIGERRTGMSNLVSRFVDGTFSLSAGGYYPDQRIKTIESEGKTIKILLCEFPDVAWAHSRRPQPSYYRSSKGIVIVYDITSRSSFDRVNFWMQEVNEHAQPEVCCVLVGNKSDLANTRAVSTEEGRALADKYGIQFLETSACEDSNVSELFMGLLARIQEIPNAVLESVPISPEPPEVKGGC